jgi:multiple sugar transport system ATP-binding protein
VLRDGVLQQCDSPQNLFHHPVNLFVAAFIGSPSMNLVEADVAGGEVSFAGLRIPLPQSSPLAGARREVILGIRPTDFTHPAQGSSDFPRLSVRPDVIEDLGGVANLLFPIDAKRVVTDATRAAEEAGSDDEGTLLADDQRVRFCASIQGRHTVSAGEHVELALDNRHLHFFDPATGAAIRG